MRLPNRNLFVGISWLCTACLTLYLTVHRRNRELQRSPKMSEEDNESIQNKSTFIKIKMLARSEIEITALNQSQIDDAIENATEPLPLSAAGCRSSAFLVIIISSHPSNFDRRNAIRGSWANAKQQELLSPDKVRIVFLLGTSSGEENNLVRNEMKFFGDIVHGSFKEAYRNATYKTLLGFKWAYFNCQAKFILKTDDDVFINLFALLKWLKSQPKVKLYAGCCHSNALVYRNLASKWYVSRDDYPAAKYPDYCAGGGYVMSGDVLKRIMLKTRRKLIPIEDAYVGILVNKLKDVQTRDHAKHFQMWFDGNIQGCAYNSLFTAHPVKPEKQLKMFLEASIARITCK